MTPDSQSTHTQGPRRPSIRSASHRPLPPQTQRIPLRLHPLAPRTRLVFHIITQIPNPTAGRTPTTIHILARSAHLPPRRTGITLNGLSQSLRIGICGLVGRLARVAHAPAETVDAGAGCSRGVLDGLPVGGDEVACCVLVVPKRGFSALIFNFAVSLFTNSVSIFHFFFLSFLPLHA